MTDASPEQRISECGKAMAIAALPVYTAEGMVHPPTLVAACARMAGYYLLRSFGVVTGSMKPGEAVLSAQASEKTPVLIRTCAYILASLGHTIPPNPPQPLIDEKTTSREDFLQTQSRLLPVFAPLRVKYDLDDYQTARAAAVATAVAAHAVRPNLDITKSFGVAAFGFAEGCQTVPNPVGDDESEA